MPRLRAIRFRDRRHAGALLAAKLACSSIDRAAIVLALPRGGVPVGFEVAVALNFPLDVLIVRKLGLPGQEELAIGAIASGGVTTLNDSLLRECDLSQEVIDRIVQRERNELQRREFAYRGTKEQPDIVGREVIVVDDGLATGSTMRAAITSLRQRRPKRIVVAVPVGVFEVCNSLSRIADEVICFQTPAPFYSVGAWYERFDATTDEEVRSLLHLATQLKSG